MKKDKTPATTELQWFEKALSIKQSEGLPEKIAAFVSTVDGEKPKTAKDLLLALLLNAETSTGKGLQDEELATKNRFIEELEEAIKGLQEDLKEKTKENEALKLETAKQKEETDRLLEENKTLKEENQAVKETETLNIQFIAGLQEKLPEVFRQEDTSPFQCVNRIVFLVNELRTQTSEAQTAKEEAEAALETEKLKPAQLQPGQAIVGFPPKQREELAMLRMLFEKQGHKFATKNAEEVVHYTITKHVDMCRMMVGLCNEFAPLMTVLNAS